MAWSSFEEDKLLAEGWRKFLQEEEQIVFGINSDKKVNPESLLSFLEKNQAAIGLSDEDVKKLLDLMLAQTKKDDVVLEAIGGPQRDARTFSSDTTTKLNALINTFQLDSTNKKKLEKVLNRWAKLNTVTFEPGEAAPPAMVTGEPDGDEEAPTSAAEPEPATDEEEAETDRIQPVSSTEPAEQPAEKTPAQAAVDLLNKVDTPDEDSVTPELFKSFVTDFSSFIRRIKATQKRPLEEITRKELAKRFGLNSSKKFDRFFNKNRKYKAIRARLTFMAKDGEAVNSFLKSFEQVAKSLPADTPAKTKSKASREPAAATPAEPAQQAAPAPEPEPEQEEAESDPTKELESYIEKVKENINKYNDPDYKSFVLPTSIDIIKQFQVKYLDLVEEQGFSLNYPADQKFSNIINNLVNALDSKTTRNQIKAEYVDYWIGEMKKAKDGMTFKNALDIFKKVVEPVKEFLLSQTNPEPAGEEEESREKSLDPGFTRRATTRIKRNYNKLKTGEKLSYNFNKWKEKIESLKEVKSIEKFEFDKTGGTSVESFDSEKNGLYLITLTNGEQFGLPKNTQDVYTLEFAFNIEGNPPGDAPLNKVTKLAKIKDKEIIEKGEITWGEKGSTIPENILNESLMLRWKTIAGIK